MIPPSQRTLAFVIVIHPRYANDPTVLQECSVL